MNLNDAIDEILGDLPWVENTRLVIGPLASREAVKDVALARAEVLPSWAIGTFYELVKDILNKSTVSVDNSELLLDPPLTPASQCDALEKISSVGFVRDAIGDLAVHLKSRPVSSKIARFLTHFDLHYSNSHELAAAVEYFQTKDPLLGAFVKIIATLWQQGELVPWGQGQLLRGALDHDGLRLPKKICLWGFDAFTPLEEALLEKFCRAGVEVHWLVPGPIREWFETRYGQIGLKIEELTPTGMNMSVWEPHSVWDEAEFLRDELANLRAKAVPWSEIAIFVPNDDLYKRVVRRKLFEWNVPIHDPTLSGAWKDRPRWLWWRDLLRAVAGGLKIDEVRAWLGFGPGRFELYEAAFKQGVHGGAGQWTKLLASHDVPELKLLLEALPIFGRAMSPGDFLAAVEKLVPCAEQLLGSQIESESLTGFARHLACERPYLSDFKARLHRYLGLFEEYLEVKSRAESLRNTDGVRFVAHGIWLPQPARHAFVLGTNLLARARPPADLWDWEAVEVRKIWEKLNSGVSWPEKIRRDEALLAYGLGNHDNVIFSAIDYALDGKPLSRSAFYVGMKGERAPTRAGGHPAVGWLREEAPDPAASEKLLRPDLVAAVGHVEPMRVSSFEDYLKCPFVYYARHVLRLEEQDELGLDPDARARGTILHKILERFLAAEINGVRYATLEAARQRIRELVEEEVSRQRLSGMYRHKPLVEKARKNLEATALRWVEWEFENRARHPEVKPYKVELPIDYELTPTFKLRGKADRIDSDGKYAVVVDYKSGSAPFVGRDLLEGHGAQLMMYGRAVENTKKLEPGALYYLTLGRKIENRSGVFLKRHLKTLHSAHPRNTGFVDREFETLFEKVEGHWRSAAERLQAGDFSPNPARKSDCLTCSYRLICGRAEGAQNE